MLNLDLECLSEGELAEEVFEQCAPFGAIKNITVHKPAEQVDYAVALVSMAGEQELPRHERAVALEPAAADQERQRAGAAAESGGLEIEEHERWPGRSAAGEERRLAGRSLEPLRHRADPLAPVQRRRLPSPIDDEATAAIRLAPRAAKGGGDVGAG